MIARPEDLLPSARDTLFLRACLHDGVGARDAWERWLDDATDVGTPVRRALVPVNAFLPLLGWNLRRVGASMDVSLQTHLRSAHLTEELRWRTYRSICEFAFRVLGDAGVPFIALKGSVVGELAYPSALFRHADDIDVLLHAGDLERAADALARAGWRRSGPSVLPSPLHAPPLVHADDVPIELHRRLVIPYYTLPYDRLWERSRVAQIAGLDVRVLSEPDSLIHACAHGMGGWPELKWVVDAWFILANSPSFDWATFTSTVTAARLDLPLYHALRYLAEHVGAPVPERVVSELGSTASRTGFVGRSAARPWPVPRVEGSWWRRAWRSWQRAFPPPLQFALHYDIPLWAVPFYYVYRLARTIA